MATATAIRVTAEQLKKFGWVNVNEDMVRDLNLTLEKYQINTPARIRHFLSQCAHESGLGKWTKELADGTLYEFRRKLGNVKPGDGPKYKGAGYLQLTGRWNYQKFANELNDPRVMEGVEYVSKKYPWASAGHFWKANNINALIDSGASVRAVTKVINPALRGLKQREEYFRRFAGLVDSTATQGASVYAMARGGTPQGLEHIVQPGESLWTIAQKYKVSLGAIQKANPGINPKNLPVRSKVKIPSARGPVAPAPQVLEHLVQPGESLWTIAQKYKVSLGAIQKANPGINPKNLPVRSKVKIPGARGPVTPAPQVLEHIVQPGETLSVIARKYKVSLDAVLKANPGINPKNLPVRSKVKIPSARGPKPSNGPGNVSWINNNHQRVWNFFKSLGFSDGATAGIMGNLQQESGMDPTKRQLNGGPGRGLAQWEKGPGKRWNQLVSKAQSEGKDPWSLNFQLWYIWYELNRGYEKKLLDRLGGMEKFKKMNIHEAVRVFEKSFERAGKPDYPSRYKYADAIYQRFAGKSVGRAM